MENPIRNEASFNAVLEDLANALGVESDDPEHRHRCCTLCVEIGIRVYMVLAMSVMASENSMNDTPAIVGRFIQLLRQQDHAGLRDYILGLKGCVTQASLDAARKALGEEAVTQAEAIRDIIVKPLS